MKTFNKILSILLVFAMLFYNFSPLIVLASSLNEEEIRTISASDINSKGNIEVELHLALPIRNREETNISLAIVDKDNNRASISLNEMKNAKDGILETSVKLKEQTIRIV